jgi:hypothetical protein
MLQLYLQRDFYTAIFKSDKFYIQPQEQLPTLTPPPKSLAHLLMFPHHNPYAFLLFPTHATCSAHFILLV